MIDRQSDVPTIGVCLEGAGRRELLSEPSSGAMGMEESYGGLLPVLPLEYEWERTFDAVPDLIMILDDQHRIVRVNRAMAAQIGAQARGHRRAEVLRNRPRQVGSSVRLSARRLALHRERAFRRSAGRPAGWYLSRLGVAPLRFPGTRLRQCACGSRHQQPKTCRGRGSAGGPPTGDLLGHAVPRTSQPRGGDPQRRLRPQAGSGP